VVTVHDLMWLTDPALCGAEGPWGRVQIAFYRDGLKRTLRRAARILAVSNATKQAIAAVDQAASSRTEVIAHGVDPAFSPARTEADRAEADAVRARLLPGARRHVLVVGQSVPYKNQRRAVEAFLSAFRDEQDVHLGLVQRLGSDARSFLELARRAQATFRVHVLPAVEREDLVALYRGAVCLCQPSLCEGWGMPVSEALGAGCPVVASRAEAISEVVQGAALQVEATSTPAIADALRRVAGDPALRASLTRDGLVRAQALSWQEHARRTADVYRRLLAEHGRG
jgi:glycosyltransferase involved in cell wall biosynthesis